MKRGRNGSSLGQPLPIPTPVVLPTVFHLSALTLPEERPLTKALQLWSVRRIAHSQVLLGAQPSPARQLWAAEKEVEGYCLEGEPVLGLSSTVLFVPLL